jgi:hypothetical protein
MDPNYRSGRLFVRVGITDPYRDSRVLEPERRDPPGENIAPDYPGPAVICRGSLAIRLLPVRCQIPR